MNRLKKSLSVLGISILFLIVNANTSQAQGRSVSLQTFYDELSYHGDWVNNQEYGYVWRPNVGRDFRPYYTNGRWVMTEYGNTWVSDYEWGWAPFHYGRWFYDSYDGWIWLPDTEWGPAWVEWRTGGGYYGWAPLGPRISVNINIGRRYYPDHYWVFIPQRCIYYPSYHRYWEPRRNVVIIRNTTVINNVYVVNRNVRYNSGPRVEDVRRATRQNVTVYKVNDSNRPGSARVERGTVNVYRPQVEARRDAAPRAIANNSSRPSRTETGTRPSSSNDNRVLDRTENNARPERSSGATGREEINRNAEGRGSSSSNNSRPERVERNNAPERPDVNNAPSRPDYNSRPERVERPSSSDRPETSNTAPSRPDYNSRPERVERERPSSTPTEGRSYPSGDSNRKSSGSEKPQSAPQRVERPSAPSSSPSRSSSGSSERGSNSRGSSENSSRSGRPSR